MPIELRIVDPASIEPKLMVKTAHYLLDAVGIKLMVNRNDPGIAMLAGLTAAAQPQTQEEEEPQTDATVDPEQPQTLTNEAAGISITGVMLDAAGLPWDRRIHSRVKTKTADGKWRYQRGTTDEQIAQVEGELRRAMNAKAPVAGPGTVRANVPPPITREPVEKALEPPEPMFTEEEYASAKATEAPDAPPVNEVPPPVAAAPVTPPPPPAAPVVPPPPAAAGQMPSLFAGFTQRITKIITNGYLSAEQIMGIINEFGIDRLPLVGSRPDLIPLINDRITERLSILNIKEV